ncbi:hypothetical protein [Thalassospira xiamenensis]|uniref:Phage abortive infection protein n=1 Tax=Thalassospira xiamenensis TaxID=220697 RepID=A0ABR5Y4R6_9PROT|nr:hypothetical protein [Thalassospira xiamenensis]KZD05427.1 hypothetical protein AUP40_00400 [Thalassospira xiamenensis]KZD11487.1 hypothetical protein AUP45_06380 [Thalassospira xiamenensis]MCD1593012.1 hypothetical protein [Thalassospira xiamenensis]
MGRWFHPALLLLCGSISGGLITAIYLTGLFGVSLPSTFELPAIPSGWGGVIGTLLTGAVAISLFGVQRYVDKADRDRDDKNKDRLSISLAKTHLRKVDEFFSDEYVKSKLRGWLDNDGYAYVPDNNDEFFEALLCLTVRAGGFSYIFKKSSNYLYEVSRDEEYRDEFHSVAIMLYQRSREIETYISGIKELILMDPESFVENDRKKYSTNIRLILSLLEGGVHSLDLIELHERATMLSR